MKSEICKALKNEIETFKGFYLNGCEFIKKAAEQYAKSLSEYPDADIAYSEAIPNLSKKDWRILAAIGRGELVPRAFMIPNDTAIQAVRVLPIHVQKSLIGDVGIAPVPQKVFSRGRVIEKKLEDMNAVEINSVIDRKSARIISIKEQIEAANAKARAESVEVEQPWAIVKGTLCVYSRTNFTVEEVSDILRKMKGGK